MRKILSLFMISLMAVFSLSAKTLYLAPNDDWKSAGARFAVYAFDNGEEWYSMTAVEGETGLYQAAVDDKYPSVIFCRMNGEAAENNWGNKWNQTQDMTIEADKNLCNISGWDNAGAWGVYTPAGGGEDDQYVYVKVTEEPTSWAGEYLIVCDGESVAFNSSLANNTTDYVGIGGKYSRFAVTIHNDTIDYHDTIAAKHFTIAAIEGKTTYSIKSESNLYIGRTSTSNGLDKSSTNVYENAISYNATSECVDIVGSSGAYMRYNKASNEQRFRFFKADTYTAQQPIQLYKKVKLEASEDPGEDPEPPVAEKDSIFFVNASDWIALRVHLWGGSAAGTEWPGVEMTPVAEQINGYEVFKLIVDKGAYANCIFNNNDKGIQTDDLDWNSGKYYYVDAWYAKEAIPAETPVTTFVGFDVQDGTLGTQLAAGLAKNRANVTFVEGEGDNQNKYSVNLVEGGVEGSFTLGGVVFAYKNSAAGATAWKTYLTYIQPNGKDREVRIPLEAGKQAKVVLSEACDGVLVNGESTDLVAGENILTATADGLVLKSGSSAKPKIQAILPVDAPDQPEELPVVKIAGSWDEGWDQHVMEVADNKLTASFTMNLEAGNYDFKIVKDGNWLSKYGTSGPNGDQYGINRIWNHADHVNIVDGPNFYFEADVTGEYTFTWTFADDSLYVAFPEAPAAPKFYVTGGEDIVGEGKATWGKTDALESYKDTLVLNLSEGAHKFKLITPAEQWLGLEALTDTAYGLYTDDDTNICFNLAEPGAVTVIFNATEFKVIGDFYIAPVANYYLIGDSAFVVDAGATADKQWTPDAIPSFKDTMVLNLKANQDYIMRLSPFGTWADNRDYRHLTTPVTPGVNEIPEDEFGNHNIGFRLDEAGSVTFIYIPAANEQPEVFKILGNFHVDPVDMKDLEIVAEGKWAAYDKLGVWAWVTNAEGAWCPVALENEKLMAHIPEECDNVLVAGFAADEALDWDNVGNEDKTKDLAFDECAKLYLSDNGAKFCEPAPAPQPEELVFTVIVPEGTDSVFIAGTFNGWTFDKMNAVEGQENKYTITKTIVDVEGLEYKYTAGRSWDYVEIREGGKNRTWAELDEVTEWLAVPQPAFEHHDFFITGNAALVGEELAWNPNAIPVDGNSYVLHLGAGKYELKVVTDDCGASNCQQWFGCERLSNEQVEGVACVAATGNIGFTLAEEGNVTVNFVLTETDTIITLTGNFYNVPMVDIKLVPGEVWSLDEAKFAAVIWNVGQTMEYDGVLTGWFVGGDTVVAQIPENTDSIAFARFAPEVETPFLNPEDPNFWNHTDKLAVDPSMIFTVMGGDVEGRNFSPGYWGERPEFIADGYFLLGNFNGWTADADYWFTPYDENQYKVTVALAVDDELKVAKYDRGYRVQWFPNNADNYVVNEKHAGSAQDIYFRPDYQGSQDWYEGCIYVVDNGATAIDNTAIDAKAEKMLKKGMILIIKGDKTYNVMGQIVK